MSNQVDKEALSEAVKKILEVETVIESDKGSYMSKCATNREKIKEIKQDARDSGVPTKELNAVLKRKKLMDQVKAVVSNMDDDEAELVDQMELALGWADNDNEDQPEAA
ncbi:hypothetical protein SAMN04488518_113138 [Pseudovibrio ascidiaceicola]|uniref:Tubulin-specific chaperone A n=1 Tax=Pseudovibrio ascidiaceicola TaxID=285279 RepID=A0A1I4E1H6_9HYPH|nr:hypothetical protein [Pseudovibrio ascidiaceicola]SFK99698.1 hypothetical protein SAMN04488518_113138 [Pseudovibrio ascidiaceicola]